MFEQIRLLPAEQLTSSHWVFYWTGLTGWCYVVLVFLFSFASLWSVFILNADRALLSCKQLVNTRQAIYWIHVLIVGKYCINQVYLVLLYFDMLIIGFKYTRLNHPRWISSYFCKVESTLNRFLGWNFCWSFPNKPTQLNQYGTKNHWWLCSPIALCQSIGPCMGSRKSIK